MNAQAKRIWLPDSVQAASVAPNAQISLFINALPKRPYCMIEKGAGIVVRDIKQAIQRPYIQANKPNCKTWLMFDVDRATSPENITDDLNLPPPNLFIQNPLNGHAHVLYSLDVPLHNNECSSRKAIRFAAAVDCSLSAAMGADARYSGLITKNPVHERWRTIQSNAMPYSLGELSDYVDLSPYNDKRKRLPEVGLGRNCTLFDKSRAWAYSARRNGSWQDFNQWADAVLRKALTYNSDFGQPLPGSEVKAIAKSISKWTWANITPQAFARIQSARGRKSGESRRQGRLFKLTRAMQLLDDGYTQMEVAAMLEVSDRQIRTWIKTGSEPYQIIAP
jgi:hypothetical protein